MVSVIREIMGYPFTGYAYKREAKNACQRHHFEQGDIFMHQVIKINWVLFLCTKFVTYTLITDVSDTQIKVHEFTIDFIKSAVKY